MFRRTSAAHDAAKRDFDRAPPDKKPSARALAAKHYLAESTIHRAPWFKAHKQAQRDK